ncbi:MAG TPA: hypothetical protein VI413_03530, partial [Paludibacter sp.]
GYTLKNNILNDDPRAKRTYLVNTVDSLKYSDALPDMSVTEFKEAVETFFNVEFVVDPRDKSISIQSLDSSIAEKKVVTLDLALDSYDRDMSQESISSRLDFTQAGYDLPDSDFCKYQKISDDNLLKCTIREFNTFADIVTYVASATSIANKLIIYRDIEKNRDYFVRDSRDGIEAKIEFYSTKVGNYSLICMINKLKYFGTSTDNTLLFSLYPAPLATDEKRIIYTRSGSAQSEFGLGFQLPQASNSYYVPKAKGFIETIEESGSDTPRNSKLEVSLFTGRIQIYPKTVSEYGNLVNYPFSHIDEYPEFPAPYHDWVNLVYKPAITKTMLLNGPNGVITDYHSSKYVDTSKEYTFTTIDSPDISANNIFVIDNLKYLPISFEWEKGNKKQPVDGKLYRML